MRKLKTTSALIVASVVLGAFFTGCASTRTENGVTIQQKRSYNPLNYLPW
jgi:hypothetical protein